MYKYLIYFLTFSFFGWLVEEIFCFIKNGKIVNRGLCRGPVCPIYGIGICLSALLLSRIDNFLLLALLSMAVATVLELVVGLFSDRVLGKRLWDYRRERGNILGYICPRFSVIWGLLLATVIKSLPLFDPFITLMSSPLLSVLVSALFALLLIDAKSSVLRSVSKNQTK